MKSSSTTDIVDALVSKGVLTEEEGKLITKGAQSKAKADEKAMKSKINIGSFIDNATVYGDLRARYERRSADRADVAGEPTYETNRSRYKFTLGVETKAGDWYSDIAFAASSNGRSDNVTFGDKGLGGGDLGMSPKDSGAVYIKRAMLGWNVTPWLSVEAGRMKNPLYMVNSMVFDHDIVMEGAQEKIKFTLGDTDIFGNVGQWVYSGSGIQANDTTGTTGHQQLILAFQAGARQAFTSAFSGKAAVGYYDYTANSSNATGASNVPFKPTMTNGTAITGQTGVNNLNILDIPAELNYMATSNIGVRAYGEYAVNTSGSDRYNDACNAYGGLYCTSAKDDDAWLVGLTIGSAKDLKAFEGKKMAKDDWSLNLWYQSVGTYALDQNAVDTDIFDGRLNMEGTTLKAQYNVLDNVALNFTGAHAERKNSQYGSSYTKADLGYNASKFDLLQFDVTYKF